MALPLQSSYIMRCTCKTTHEFESIETVSVLDSIKPYDEIWVLQCSRCEALWLRVFFDTSQYSKSRQWFDALLAQKSELNGLMIEESIEEVFLNAPLSFQGGGWLGGKVLPFKGLPKPLI